MTALPKGGAASRAVDDLFSPRLATGSIAYRIPLAMPRGRVEDEVELELVYDQLAAGASPFGSGWGIVLPGIRRRTGHGTPGYAADDVFTLTTGEELVPVGGDRFRTRVEGFRRIARIGDGWEITEPDGTRYELGIDAERRVADPADPTRVFEWLTGRRTDTNGNVVEYRWLQDDRVPRPPDGRPSGGAYPHEVRWCHASDGRPLCVARFAYDFTDTGSERPDAATSLMAGFAQRMSWRCRAILAFCADLGTPGPGVIDLVAAAPGAVDPLAFVAAGAVVAADGGVVFERWAAGVEGVRAAGDGRLDVSLPIALADVTVRLQVDAAGSYEVLAEAVDGSEAGVTAVAAGAGPLAVPLPSAAGPIRRVSVLSGPGGCLVQRLSYGAGNPRPAVSSRYDLDYHPTATETALDRAAVAPTASLLASVTRVGYDAGLAEARMPPIRLGYSRLDLTDLWPDQIGGSPREALSDPDTTLISFTGNARVDVLQTKAGHRCFVNGGRLGAAVSVSGHELATSPPVDLSDTDTYLRDVNGRGSVDLSTEAFFYNNPATSPTPVDPGHLQWGDFEQFDPAAPHPVLTPAERPVTRAMDLDGDGNLDLLQTGAAFTSWRNLGGGRWGQPARQQRRHSFGAREWPDVSLDDPAVRIADMNGDGLDELVRVSARKVEYWAQVAGRFSFKQTILGAPRIRGFNPRRCFVVDLTNDGCADLVYLGSGRVSVWLNQGGTRFAPELVIDLTDPAVSRGVRIPDDADAIEPVDLVGDGVKGLLWSFTRAGTEGNYYFMPLSRGTKPGLLTSIDNGLGGRIEVEWTTSAVEAATAEAQGEPWASHAPFPASVAKRVRKLDQVGGSVEECEFGYRDAHHDRLDRHFLGFRVVTETFTGDDGGGPARRIVHEFATRDVLRLSGAALAEARALAGRESRVRHFDARDGRLLSEVVTAWAAQPVHQWAAAAVASPIGVVNAGDPLAQPRLVVATHELHAAWEGAAGARYRLIEHRYDSPGHPGVPDEFGNLREEVDHGEVGLAGVGPPLATIGLNGSPTAVFGRSDPTASLTRFEYAVNRPANVVAKVSRETRWVGPGFARLFSETRQYYDGGASRDDHLPLGQVDQGNLQRRERLVAFEADIVADFGAGFLGQIGAGPANGPGHMLRSNTADGRAALFAIELRRRFQRSGSRIVHGLVTGHFSARGFETAFAYDAEGWAPARVTNARGHSTVVRRFGYAFSQPERLEDANGTVVRNDVDHFGRVIATWADASSGGLPDVEWVYDFDVHRAGPNTFSPVSIEQRQLIDRLESPARHLRTITYLDGFGREIQRRQSAESSGGPQWAVTARAYGAQALMTREWLPFMETGSGYSAPAGTRPVRSLRHDGLGRLVETTWPDGSVDRVEREPWVVVEHDREDTAAASPHHDTPRRIESDASGRTTRVVDRLRYAPAGEDRVAETLTRHDVDGRLVERRDPDGLVATTTWTATGRLLVRRHPDAGERLTFHDAAGNRIFERDARGATIWLRYDEIDRIAGEVRGVSPVGPLDLVYAYDDAATLGVGLLRSVAAPATGDGVTFEYDSRGNVARMTRRIAGQAYDFGQRHNSLGLLARRTYPNGDVVEQRFGVDGRVATIIHTSAATGIRSDLLSAVGWTADGQLQRLSGRAGAVEVTVTYDPRSLRMGSIAARDAAGTPLLALTYASRDLMGNVLTLRDDSVPAGPVTETYAYDSAYRLRVATLGGGGVPPFAYTYSYAPNGRLVHNGELGADHAYDAGHPNAPVGTVGGVKGYSYDAAGNMVSTPQLQSLTWDARGQLERVVLAFGGGSDDYRYDHEGTRTRREARRPGSAAAVTVYADRDYEVRDGQASIAITLGETRLGEVDAAGAVRFFLLDQLSSVRDAVDGAGVPIPALHERFRPYGGTHVAPAASKRFRFAGRERDSSGLYWFDGRYYEPEIAAWASVDPAGQFDSPYIYAGGNPLNLVDLDARDAVAVVFPDYKIAALGTKWGNLGHAGVLLIDNRTGMTRYYEYGRYDKAEIGIVRSRTVPNVQMRDGRPTKESLAAVLKSISKQSGHGTRVEGALVRTEKFKEMNQYAQDRLKLNSDKKRAEYDLFDNNCGTFMVSTIEASGTDLPAVVDPRPNSIIDEVRSEHQTVDWSAKRGLKLGKPVDQRQPATAK